MAVPDILHFAWFAPSEGAAIPPSDAQENIKLWQEFHPGYETRIWTGDDLRPLLAQFHGMDVWSDIETCRFEAMRADIARLALMFEFGGFWSDFKNRPLRSFLKELGNDSGPILVEHAPTTQIVDLSNSFFGAPPKHEFFMDCLENACSNVRNRIPGGVFGVTGPAVIKMIWKIWQRAGRVRDFKVFPHETVWDQRGQNGWMRRTSASYNAADMKAHWSVRQKSESLYLP